MHKFFAMMSTFMLIGACGDADEKHATSKLEMPISSSSAEAVKNNSDGIAKSENKMQLAASGTANGMVKARDFVGKFATESIKGKKFFDTGEVEAAILDLPSGELVLRNVKRVANLSSFNVSAPIKIDENGSIIFELCQENNCGGNTGGQVLIEYSPEYKDIYVCINEGRGSTTYTRFGKEYVGSACVEGGFYYGD